MIFEVDVGWDWASARAEKFHSMCTQTAYTENSVKFGENGPKPRTTKKPEVCILGVHTHTTLSGLKGLTMPQNISKFHDLTLNASKDILLLILVAEMDTTFL